MEELGLPLPMLEEMEKSFNSIKSYVVKAAKSSFDRLKSNRDTLIDELPEEEKFIEIAYSQSVEHLKSLSGQDIDQLSKILNILNDVRKTGTIKSNDSDYILRYLRRMIDKFTRIQDTLPEFEKELMRIFVIRDLYKLMEYLI
jgi:hypothetical protein